MKLLLAVIITLSLVGEALAVSYVPSYNRKDGTYVSGHYRDTSNDGYEYNNANYNRNSALVDR